MDAQAVYIYRGATDERSRGDQAGAYEDEARLAGPRSVALSCSGCFRRGRACSQQGEVGWAAGRFLYALKGRCRSQRDVVELEEWPFSRRIRVGENGTSKRSGRCGCGKWEINEFAVVAVLAVGSTVDETGGGDWPAETEDHR